MLHALIAPAPAIPAAANSNHPPLTPAAYMRLRRKASGLTIEQVAERLEPRFAERWEVRQLLRQLETDGVRALHVTTLDFFREAYPLDPNVYFQLLFEPAERHPAICRGCGCSRWDPCEHETLGACSWAASNAEICTRCTNGETL